MSVLRRTPVHVEVIALIGAIAIAWWLGSHATLAWFVRVAELQLKSPDANAVHAAARTASLYFSAGTVALIAARLWTARRIGESTVHVPWLLPAAAGASLLGLAFHLATVETSHGAALVPSGAGFAQGYLIGCLGGA